MSGEVKVADFNTRFYEILQKNIELLSIDESVLKSDLETVGLNSISFVKLIVALENEFDVEFENEILIIDHFATLEQFKDSVQKLVEGQDH
ncbi:acyl carrier protein [Paenibacillus algorifonticola]|uniref:Acyl carrier protein n=1 Tax=Paenibacillus algorifonticola TaxID=684063 RepID=A0A1I1YT58_9BACL|nr:phosphopantetheine-binding protein [Paenibacillus algorifonticola]SFE22726.1 acyl carrier protein [Paenibacillus algorifonticola]